ncbi:MAG TPA: DUF1761 domain-containing protein [Candidatus Saccharimonadales bacterium]|nr:DUF1761 domain-containing protein [Candidatus Saccharimonadales bacterium]
MESQVSVVAVLLAAFSSMVVGMLWYMPATFGTAWQKYTGVDAEKMRKSQSGGQLAWMYGSVFVASLVTAFVVAQITFYFHLANGNSRMSDALQAASLLWLGLTAARIYVHDTFEGRRKKLTLLTTGHELVTVLVMALIIGAIKP